MASILKFNNITCVEISCSFSKSRLRNEKRATSWPYTPVTKT